MYTTESAAPATDADAALAQAQLAILNAEVAKWRKLSRKHEARAKASRRKLLRAEALLAAIRTVLETKS